MAPPCALLIVSVALAPIAQAADVAVRATREGDVLLIEASAEFEADAALTWRVLTDYDRLPEFIPNLRMSKVVARAPGEITVEQKGVARLLVFSYPVEVRLAVTESPPVKVVSRAVSGNFREMSSVYALETREGRVRLTYSGRMVPDFFVPPLIGTWVLRHNVEVTFSALVDEMVRRQREALAPK
jgi:ribosome-associated toxin RatA of RatAB toxin-antitoxin module